MVHVSPLFFALFIQLIGCLNVSEACMPAQRHEHPGTSKEITIGEFSTTKILEKGLH